MHNNNIFWFKYHTYDLRKLLFLFLILKTCPCYFKWKKNSLLVYFRVLIDQICKYFDLHPPIINEILGLLPSSLKLHLNNNSFVLISISKEHFKIGSIPVTQLMRILVQHVRSKALKYFRAICTWGISFQLMLSLD